MDRGRFDCDYSGNSLFNCTRIMEEYSEPADTSWRESLTSSDIAHYVAFSLVIAVVVAAFFSTFYIVMQQTAAVVERFGKFLKVSTPGLHLKFPFVDDASTRIDLQIRQLDVKVETKTKDNVFVDVMVAVQHLVLPDKVFEAAYKLSDPREQITSYVFDVVRAKVPRLELDDLFEKKDEIADAVKAELSEVMDEFGYFIVKALVVDIDPDAKVKASMNEINAAQRMRVAATEKGEADRILAVKAAEAEAQSKALQGKGIADQRRAISDGMRESIEAFKSGVPGTSAADVMQLVLVTQYFDTLKEIGTAWDVKTLVMPNPPSLPGSLADTMSVINGPSIARPSPGSLISDLAMPTDQ